MPTNRRREDVQDEIVARLRKGNYRQVAAQSAGISRRTLYNWIQKGRANLDAVEAGRAELDEWGLFLLEVEKAEADAEVKIVEDVIDLANRLGKPEVLLKFLERRYPDRYGRRQLEIVRSTADVAAEAAVRRRALRETIAERKSKLGAVEASQARFGPH